MQAKGSWSICSSLCVTVEITLDHPRRRTDAAAATCTLSTWRRHAALMLLIYISIRDTDFDGAHDLHRCPVCSRNSCIFVLAKPGGDCQA